MKLAIEPNYETTFFNTCFQNGEPADIEGHDTLYTTAMS